MDAMMCSITLQWLHHQIIPPHGWNSHFHIYRYHQLSFVKMLGIFVLAFNWFPLVFYYSFLVLGLGLSHNIIGLHVVSIICMSLASSRDASLFDMHPMDKQNGHPLMMDKICPSYAWVLASFSVNICAFLLALLFKIQSFVYLEHN